MIGFIGGLLFVAGVIDLIAAIKSDEHIAERIIGFASAAMFLAGAIMVWCI